VVMPTSLLHNWQNELKRFAPNLKVYLYSGSKRLKSIDIHKVFKYFDVVITTYGTLRNDIHLLQTCSFHHLILDESQYVKNPDSLIYKAVKQIKAKHKLALTGTPIENSLTDLWAQLNIVNEGLLGSLPSFQRAYINPIVKQNKNKEEALLRIIQPFLLRRTKNEVAPELPPLSQETVYCDMSETQQKRYDEEKNKLRNSILINDNDLDAHKLAFLTLQGLTRLRLLANHPRLWEEDYGGDSGKFEQVIMRLETLKSEHHKVLIFSSFVKHLRLLADHFDKEQWKYAWLSGSTAASSRESEIDQFSNNPEVSYFLISLKAGGVGLNLTAADYVFILDPWWNPASEMQALGRAHRIGQQKNVMVYRFISTGTIEEKIRNLQESKSKLADTFINSSNPLKGLNKSELVHLID
jgi:SNF2 family DNA or RNA helicase